VGLVGVLLGGAVADVAPDGDEAGPLVQLCQLDGVAEGLEVVGVLHPQGVPAVGPVAGQDVLGEGQVGGAVNGDAVVVPEDDELGKPPGPSQGAGLSRDPLHQVSVRGQDVGVVVHHHVAGAVELGGQLPFRQGHPHGGGDPLPQRPRGHLHPRGVAVLGVARGLGAPLAEALELLQGKVVAREVEDGVKEHGAVPSGEDEAVPVGPGGVQGVVAQDLPVEEVGQGGHGHGHARVAALGLFHGVYGQEADGVHRKGGEVFGLGHRSLQATKV
jgi:hypothetical protein